MIIELDNVWYKYPGSSKWVLKNINHVFKKGKIYVLIGPNASGKTTLLKISSLLYKPTKGNVLVNGMDFWKLDSEKRLILRRKIVYVHEKPILLKGTVLYNISFGLMLRNIDKETAYKKAREFLEKIGLDHLIKKNVNELSAGEAQIVSILRAIILEPELLFLDEPLAHIDIEKRNTIINLIKKLKNKDMGIIIATHDMYLVNLLADEVIITKNRTIHKKTQ